MSHFKTTEFIATRLRSLFGLRPAEDWPRTLQAGMADMARRRGWDTLRLVGALTSDIRLLTELAGYVTVGETYFMRHSEQLDLLIKHLAALPLYRLACVWSAGCASGEEAYSIALLLAADAPHLIARTSIVGSDLSPFAILKARQACYGSWSFRGAPAWIEQYFETSDAGLTLVDTIRQRVAFVHGDSLTLAQQRAEASVDIIVFRNVAIYLEAAGLAQLYSAFARVLRPDGRLYLAPTDPLPDQALFQPTRESATILQRTTTSTQTRRPHSGRRRSSQKVATEPAVTAAMDTQSAPQKIPTPTPSAWVNAPSPAGSVLQHLRRCVFLEPGHLLARYSYATALRSAGRVRPAIKQLEELQRRLHGKSADAVLEDGETTAGVLQSAVSSQLHLMAKTTLKETP